MQFGYSPDGQLGVADIYVGKERELDTEGWNGRVPVPVGTVPGPEARRHPQGAHVYAHAVLCGQEDRRLCSGRWRASFVVLVLVLAPCEHS